MRNRLVGVEMVDPAPFSSFRFGDVRTNLDNEKVG
jgi:hypothetical protein